MKKSSKECIKAWLENCPASRQILAIECLTMNALEQAKNVFVDDPIASSLHFEMNENELASFANYAGQDTVKCVKNNLFLAVIENKNVPDGIVLCISRCESLHPSIIKIVR